MLTLITLCVIGFFCFSTHSRHVRTGAAVDSRRRLAWIGAFIGAAVGSFFGIAGLGDAIIGTIPGGVVGYLVASHFVMKMQLGESVEVPSIDVESARTIGGKIKKWVASKSAAPTPPGSTAYGKSIQQSSSTSDLYSTFGKIAKQGIYVVLILISFFVFFLVKDVVKSNPTRHTETVSVAQNIEPEYSNEPARLPSPPASPIDAMLQAEVNRLEKRFPQLLPNNEQYDQRVVDAIVVNATGLEKAGMAPHLALRQAAEQTLLGQAAAAPAGLAQASAAPRQLRPVARALPEPEENVVRCQFKAVMSDSEYRACGVEPPATE